MDDLTAAYERRDEELRRERHRSLPFGDAMFDRWERAKRLGFAEGASIYNSAVVFEPVTVGEHTWIGPMTLLDGSGGGISIGRYCSISAGVHVYTHDTVAWAISGGESERTTAPVAIGDCCYVGPMAIISAGVTVGRQSVIGANSFVSEPVPDQTVVAGSPARPIGRVEGTGPAARIVRL